MILTKDRRINSCRYLVHFVSISIHKDISLKNTFCFILLQSHCQLQLLDQETRASQQCECSTVSTQCTVNSGARHLRQSTINILKCCILWLLVVWRVRVCVNTPSSPDTSTTARDTCGISRLGDQIWLTVVNISGSNRSIYLVYYLLC